MNIKKIPIVCSNFLKKKNFKKKINNFFLIDAEKMNLGRLSSKVSILLTGKNSIFYRKDTDCKHYVVIYNSEKVEITGKKESKKLYYRHSGQPGGLKIESFLMLKKRFPEKIIETAIKGMLPKNSLGRKYLRHLKIFKGMGPYGTNQKLEIEKFKIDIKKNYAIRK
jgi:large subunit ribosomal protein L13